MEKQGSDPLYPRNSSKGYKIDRVGKVQGDPGYRRQGPWVSRGSSISRKREIEYLPRSP